MTKRLKAVPISVQHSMDELSDDDLMRLSALDRKDAFEILVTRHLPFVFGLAARFLGDRQAGRDIAQDVFLALWADRDKYQRRGVFRGYLAAICLNRCRATARDAKNQDKKTKHLESEAAGDFGDAADIPLEELLKIEQSREMQRRLAKLPETTRVVLIYRFTHDMPLLDIVKLTGMPLGTVKSHVARGLLRIRRMMTKGN